MNFKTGEDFVNQFISIPKDSPIKWIKHNGSVTQYVSDTFVKGIEPIYEKIPVYIKLIYILLLQDGNIKKYKYYPDQNLEIKFASEPIGKDIDPQGD